MVRIDLKVTKAPKWGPLLLLSLLYLLRDFINHWFTIQEPFIAH
ncbi:hypothetical protein EDF66_108188 [Sphingobacterium sp. JUb20]|nr:hypothetical protein [Sphingobacterium sp. JUb21]TCR03671.1 hypothetical protein EDF66_108188 [Sphingobacterium sp. JUb20]